MISSFFKLDKLKAALVIGPITEKLGDSNFIPGLGTIHKSRSSCVFWVLLFFHFCNKCSKTEAKDLPGLNVNVTLGFENDSLWTRSKSSVEAGDKPKVNFEGTDDEVEANCSVFDADAEADLL